jgi:hypothetical protein
MVDDNVPLRGWVICQGCGGFHTGGKSKGRGGFYYYYRCKKCLNRNNKHRTIMKKKDEIGLTSKSNQHLSDFTEEEKKMIELMSDIIVRNILRKYEKSKIKPHKAVGVEPILP